MANETMKPVISVAQAVQLARDGKYGEAELACRQILADHPAADEALNLLGVLRSMAGHAVEAEGVIRRAIAIDGNVPKYFNNLGNACKAQGKREDSVQAYRRAVELDANFVDALYNLGVVLAEQGELEAALENYGRAIRLIPSSFEAQNNAGLVLMRLGRYEEAEEAFNRAKELHPSAPGVWHNLGLARKATGNEEGALEAFLQATGLQPDYVEPMLEAAELYSRENESTQACHFYEQVLEMEENNLRALEGLAWVYESANQLNDLPPVLEKGLNLSPDSLLLNLVRAKLLRRSSQEREALGVLSSLDLPQGRDDVVAAVLHEKGMLHDRLGEPDSAFACFGEGKRMQAAVADRLGADKSRYLEKISHLREEFERCGMASWKPLDLAPLEHPLAFIVGFPRSGTTLLDQVLDSHPRVATIEEQPLLATLMEELESHPAGLMAALEELTPAQATALRHRYFELAAQYVELGPGQMLVDKFPLNIIRAPLIHRLFPDAKIILAIRHPCDVCLSCYMHLFGINNAMANFFSLEDAIHLYGKVMDLWRIYVERLPLNFHRIRYEDVVNDFQGEISGLLDFLGLEWDERVNAFYEHAKGKGKINTPSYHQVTEPIYRRAAYRWKRYERFFEPYRQEIAPYLDLFGYESR